MTDKVDILAIGVHPDDIELGCGGTIVKHIDLGFTVLSSFLIHWHLYQLGEEGLV